MSTETPGKHLARLRVQFGDRFRVDRNGSGFVARDRKSGKKTHADTLGGLEGKLIAQLGLK
jgi:hypothetical protein